MKHRICVALDVASSNEAMLLAQRLSPWVGMFKIGSQLFTSEGPKVIDMIRGMGSNVFLDLKFHDIPNTVIGAAQSAADHGVFMLNVHSLGGTKMMRALAEHITAYSARKRSPRPMLIAVTVLTSLSEDDLRTDLLIETSINDYVVHLATQAKQAGLDGVVCSPQEINVIRRACGPGFKLVVPGIRPAWASQKADQVRIITPEQAISDGADYIVVGRPVIAADNPEQALQRILTDIERAGPQ